MLPATIIYNSFSPMSVFPPPIVYTMIQTSFTFKRGHFGGFLYEKNNQLNKYQFQNKLLSISMPAFPFFCPFPLQGHVWCHTAPANPFL